MNYDEHIKLLMESISNDYEVVNQTISPSREIDSTNMKPLYFDVTLRMSLKDLSK